VQVQVRVDKFPRSVLVSSSDGMEDAVFIRHYNLRHPELNGTLGELPEDLEETTVDRYRDMHEAAHREYPGTGHHHNKRNWRKA
jgi:hypothetical protein